MNDASKVFKAADKGADATKTAKNTAKSINAERQKAVRQAWKEEKVLVESGADGTRRWTKAEKKNLNKLEKSKVMRDITLIM